MSERNYVCKSDGTWNREVAWVLKRIPPAIMMNDLRGPLVSHPFTIQEVEIEDFPFWLLCLNIDESSPIISIIINIINFSFNWSKCILNSADLIVSKYKLNQKVSLLLLFWDYYRFLMVFSKRRSLSNLSYSRCHSDTNNYQLFEEGSSSSTL